MKKNKILRLASVMLMLCLITTCAISGTFAKYTTSGTVNDSARVAKWGVTFTVANVTDPTDGTTNLFADTYKNDAVIGETAINAGVSIDSADSAKVIAPGEEQSVKLTIAGTPEVALKLDVTAAVTLTGWTIDSSEFYCPIIFKVQVGSGAAVEVKADASTVKTAALLEEALEKAIVKAILGLEDSAVPAAADSKVTKSVDYTANSTLDKEITISWDWDYTATGTYQTDAKDTKLGDLSTAPVLAIDVDLTATQID